MGLREDTEAALARFKLVEPVTIDDMKVIAQHVRFALGGDAKVEVFRNTQAEPLYVCAFRGVEIARTFITPFASADDARAHGSASPRS